MTLTNSKEYSSKQLDDMGVTIVHHLLKISAVIHVDLVLNMKHVSSELLQLLAMFSGALNKV